VSERVGYIARVRKLARRAAAAYLTQRRELGFPLLTDPNERERWLPAAKQEAKSGA
jgi:glycyl-tRNA synthetase alpha chain